MTLNLSIDPRALSYPVIIRPDQYPDGKVAYIAEIPELPGCKSHGKTPEEAKANLEDAKREYLEALKEAGLEIPVPSPDQAMPSVVWTMLPMGIAAQASVVQEVPSFSVLLPATL